MAYYIRSFNALPLTFVRSQPLVNEFDRIANSFNAVETKTNASIKAPDGETLSDLPSAAVRASKGLVFDVSGQPAVQSVATEAQMNAAISATAASAQSASDSAALAASLAAPGLIALSISFI